MNPDNVATPIAASLGDVTTLSLLAWIADLLYKDMDKGLYTAPILIGGHRRWRRKVKYLVANAALFIYYFTDRYWDEYILHKVILLGGCMVVWMCTVCIPVIWRLACFGAALTWLWLGLKSAEELSHSPQWGSTVRTLVDCPMGRFVWTNHIYFQITQPGSSTLTLLYQ